MPRSSLTPEKIAAFRDALCSAAERRFAEEGYAGVTLRALARELGCSPMTPYRYFRDKEAIFAAVRASAFARFADAQETAAARESEPLARLAALQRAYVRFALGEPHAYRIMFELAQPDAPGHPELEKQERRAWQALRDAVGEAAAAGLLRGDPEILAHVFWASVHGLVALQLAGKLKLGVRFEGLEAPLLETLLRGALASTSPRPSTPKEDPR
jgi:AcrR family transcriptional regulator